MLSSLKNYALAALGLAAAIFAALFYRSKAKYEGAMRKGVEQARKTEQKATDALTSGLNNERKARDAAKSAIRNRNYFG